MAKNSDLSAFASNRYKGLSFDQLNALYDAEHDRMSMDYDEYFGDMDLSDEQKDRRKDSAEDLEEVFEVLLALVLYLYMEEAYDYSEAIAEAQEAYQDILAGADVSDYYREVHVPNAVNSVVNTMLQNPDNPFNFSVDRAIMIAENEANSIWNDAEYEEALKSGKKYKTWHTIIDKRTRATHREINGKTIPIREYFVVGNSLMLFPKDSSASDEEVVNCRCSLTYK